MDDLQVIVAREVEAYLGNDERGNPPGTTALDIADRILAIPRIVDALEALRREESYSSIYDDRSD